MDLQKKLKNLLELRDMKPADLAKMSGLTPGLISGILSGKRGTVQINTIEKISKALGINPGYFFEENTIAPQEILSYMSEEDREFFSNPKNLPWAKLTHEAASEGRRKPCLYLDRGISYRSKESH